MNTIQEKRLKAIRARATVRRWEYRQRDSAKGVWYRLRRLLALSAEAWEISEADAVMLASRACPVESAGRELAPPKYLFMAPRSALAALPGRRAIPVGLGPEFLGARAVVLVPYESDGADGTPPSR